MKRKVYLKKQKNYTDDTKLSFQLDQFVNQTTFGSTIFVNSDIAHVSHMTVLISMVTVIHLVRIVMGTGRNAPVAEIRFFVNVKSVGTFLTAAFQIPCFFEFLIFQILESQFQEKHFIIQFQSTHNSGTV